MSTHVLTHGPVTWVNLVQPTDDDLQALARAYPRFHPLNLHDCRAGLEYPKLDHHDDYLFLVMHFPVYEKRQRLSEANEVDIFVAEGLLVTAHQARLAPLAELYDACTRDPAARAEHMGRGAGPLLHTLLDRLVSYCFPILQKVSEHVRDIETRLFAHRPREVLEEIAVVRRDLIELRRILRPQYDVVCALADGNWPWIQSDLDPYWHDVRDRLRQLGAMLDDNVEVISGLAETIDTLASHRIDEVVRLLTVATVITLPVTLAATIFGMNIALPGEEHPLTFFGVVVAALLATAWLAWYLRRRDWL